MSHKFKLNDVKLGDNTDFQMSIGTLEVETSVEVYKLLIPFYKDILSMISNVFKSDKKTDAEKILDAMGEGAQKWATDYGKKRSEELKKENVN